MKKSLFIILAGGILAIYSCGDKKTAADETTPTEPTVETVPGGDAESVPPVETGAVTPDGGMPAGIGEAPASTPTATSASGPLNPAHGEPGHRCDISVGAPLSSAPTTAPGASGPAVLPGPGQAPITQKIEMPASGSAPGTIISSPAPGTAPATVTAPGMNPPHGQPGHDCAVAVGAPLKK